jgi:fructose-bisphosphate aldolase class II
MPLVHTGDLVAQASTRSTGIAAFNVITIEHAEGIVSGAEQAGTPVILQISHNAVRFHGNRLRPLAAACRELAHSTTVDVALHLDHVESSDLLHQTADAGCSSAMFDAGNRPYSDNVAATAAAVDWAEANGIWLEAELGYVGGKPEAPISAHADGVRTDPDEATAFVESTGVQALAVAVGSSHAMSTRSATLDLDLITRLRDAVPVPLVLHGSSGVPDEQITRAVAAGIVKVNIGTALNLAFTGAVREVLSADSELSDPRRYIKEGRTAISSVVSDLLGVVTTRPRR